MIDRYDNISDEMLAAYLDGNASMEECSLIQDQMESDSMLSEVIDIVNDVNHLGLTMANDNLIMDSMDDNWDLNSGMDILSSPLQNIPGYNDSLSQFDSFENGFDGDNYYNDLACIIHSRHALSSQ